MSVLALRSSSSSSTGICETSAQVVPLVLLVVLVLQEMCPYKVDGWSGRVTESHGEAPLLPVSFLFVRTQDRTTSSTIAFQKIVLGEKSK